MPHVRWVIDCKLIGRGSVQFEEDRGEIPKEGGTAYVPINGRTECVRVLKVDRFTVLACLDEGPVTLPTRPS